MARKRNIENTWPDATPEKQLLTKSGWCSDEFHNQCKYQFTFGKCGCECHKEIK